MMSNHIQLILPTMCRLFNNSPLTQKVANSLVEKLDEKEFRDLTEWLKHANSSRISLEQKSKRRW